MQPLTRKPRRILLLSLAVLLVGMTLAAIALYWLWPEQGLRERMARQASERLGTTVTVSGDISPQLWPAPGIRLENVTLDPAANTATGTPTATVEAIEVAMGWLPLLRGKMVPARVLLEKPIIHLPPAALEGWQPAQANRSGGEPVPIALTVRDGTIDWGDSARGLAISASGVDLDVPPIRWTASTDAPATLALGEMQISAETLKLNALTVTDLSLRLVGENGVFRTEDWQMTALGDRGTGKATLDPGASPPRIDLEFAFDALDLERLPEQWLHGGQASGRLSLWASLDSQGHRTDELLRHLNGQVRLKGDGLVLHGMDLDAELADYRRTQRFNLVDAAAVAFMGPVWLVATKGSDFVRLIDATDGGDTRITQLVSEWEIKDGTALARDVALATPRNRLATQASLDLVRRTINHATVAAIDARGCAVLKQSIHGPFAAPQTEAPSFAEGLLGAPIDLLRRGLGAISGDKPDCEVFYRGSVTAPSG